MKAAKAILYLIGYLLDHTLGKGAVEKILDDYSSCKTTGAKVEMIAVHSIRQFIGIVALPIRIILIASLGSAVPSAAIDAAEELKAEQAEKANKATRS